MLTSERLLITGATGQLGGYVVARLQRDAARHDCDIYALTGRSGTAPAGVKGVTGNLRDTAVLRSAVREIRPARILHIGAMTAVSDAHANPDEAERVNVEATRVLLEATEKCRQQFVFTSTDMVFDGDAAPYAESAPPRPLSVYGRSKATAEALVEAAANALVVRLPLMYGFPLTSRPATFVQQIQALRSGTQLRLFTDEFRTPVWLGDAARAVVGLAYCELTGIIHAAGPQRLSRYDLIAGSAQILGLPTDNLVKISRHDVPAAEPRPADLSLAGSRLAMLFPELTPGPLRAEALAGGPA
jgi:dTDP-4-dehydrorhamnose reductase